MVVQVFEFHQVSSLEHFNGPFLSNHLIDLGRYYLLIAKFNVNHYSPSCHLLNYPSFSHYLCDFSLYSLNFQTVSIFLNGFTIHL